MKKHFLLIIIVAPLLMFAQFNEDFGNGNFTNPQSWIGDASDFTINDSLWLQLNAPAQSNEKYLSTNIATQGETTWRFKAFYDFTNPSTSNYAKIYLSSDNADLSQNLNGYFIQIGGITGSDDAITLNKQSGNTTTEICSSALGLAAINQFFNIEIVRDANNLWTLNLDLDNDGTFTFESSGTDDTFTFGDFIGVFTKFSSTRNDAYLFDDFYVNPVFVDDVAPTLNNINVVSDNQIELNFNEPLSATEAENILNFSVDGGIQNPSMAILSANQTTITLIFDSSFPSNQNLNITIDGIEDLAGNVITTINDSFSYSEEEEFAILITEIFADFDPTVALPEEEFLEIYNNTNATINIEDFTLSDLTSETELDFYELATNEYLILTANANVELFQDFGNVLGVSNFPGLNNAGDEITIKNAEGKIMHSVFYDDAWYKDENKENGGYSLEMIDLTNYCEAENNWIASNDISGGTPGKINSVNGSNPDDVSPFISAVIPISDNQISVSFSEFVEEDLALTIENYTLSEGLIVNQINYNSSTKTYDFEFNSDLESGIAYEISAVEIQDCAGNIIENNAVTFGLPENIETNDIVINEILFNAVTGGSDYVELYNKSDKILDLANLIIAKADTVTDFVADTDVITETSFLFFPKTYVAITENKNHVEVQYLPIDSAIILEINDLPTYDDKEGIVVLLNNFNEEIDRVNYFESWHFDLIDDKNGVALERLEFESESQNKNNWHSSSSLNNFGTPGYQNSQQKIIAQNQNIISLDKKVFSPDADGFEDFLTINFETNEPGWIANITAFDQRGRFVKYISKNETLPANGFVKWDGTQENGEKNATGIYIIFAELFDLNGNIQKFKESCAITYQ